MNAVKYMVPMALLFLLCGCWDSAEIKNQIIVAGISIDQAKDPNSLEVGFEFLPMPVGAEEPIIPKVVTIEGTTLQQCVQDISDKTANRPYLNHANLVLVSKQIAEHGIRDIVETMVINPQYPLTSFLAVSTAERAVDFFSAEGLTSAILSYEATSAFQTHEENTGKSPTIYVYEIYPYLTNPYAGYVLPAIGIVTQDDKEIPHNDGGIIFLKDRMVGQLSPTEMQYFSMATGHIQSATVTLDIGENNSPIACTLMQSTCRYRVHFEEGKPIFSLLINQRFSTRAVPGRYDSQKLEAAAANAVAANISRIIEKSQKELNCDFFGFSTYLDRFHHEKWLEMKNSWDVLFPDIVCQVIVSVNIID